MRWLKNAGKAFAVAMLGWQVRRLQARNSIKTIGVVGSYGKTSTKYAIATMLSKKVRVRFQAGNYNDIVSVPLIFFDEELPSLLNPLAWTALFIRNELQLRRLYQFDVVVLELGTDGPGQIAAFQRYLHLDYAVLTAIAHEHMEFFADLQAVAAEELAVRNFSKQLIYNADLCDAKYFNDSFENTISFGFDDDPAYKIQKKQVGFMLKHDGKTLLEEPKAFIKARAYSIAASATVGYQLGMSAKDIEAGSKAIEPVGGRLQFLQGIRSSTILDDTYNASPDATKAALDVLYEMSAPHKVALLGNMNELGRYSKNAHVEIGEYCDPKQLELVITLGPDSNKYLAPAAEKRGCKVKPCTSPYEVGEFLKDYIEDDTLVLIKGSQNKVFAEEAVKYILEDPADASRLVRQSPQWLKKKSAAFRR